MSKATIMNEKNTAKQDIIDSIRDLLTLKIKLPLGNPNLKLLHTNQFLWTELPSTFELANMSVISKSLNNSYSRFSGYTVNRWYIEQTTVTNNGSELTMELEVNPFASSLNNFKDDRKSLFDAYNNAQKNTNKTTKSSKKKTVKSVPKKNTSLKGGEGKYINNLVKDIVGNETDALKKAKKIHNYLQHYLVYKGYSDSRHSSAKSCHKAKHINCADTSRLTASMMRSANVDCFVVHSTCHYYTVIKYKGKLYCSDATSNYRNFNTYWQGSSCDSGSTRKFTGKNCYYAVCGKNPCS